MSRGARTAYWLGFGGAALILTMFHLVAGVWYWLLVLFWLATVLWVVAQTPRVRELLRQASWLIESLLPVSRKKYRHERLRRLQAEVHWWQRGVLMFDQPAPGPHDTVIVKYEFRRLREAVAGELDALREFELAEGLREKSIDAVESARENYNGFHMIDERIREYLERPPE